MDAALKKWRACSFAELSRLIRDPDVSEIVGRSGKRYQIEVEAVWDSAPGGDLRVLASIDDGGWRAIVPLTRDFIMMPDGTIVP